MKANHNDVIGLDLTDNGAFNISKIQDESKSQHRGAISSGLCGAFNISKIQDESKSQHAPEFELSS